MLQFFLSQEHRERRRFIATVRHALTSADQHARMNAVYELAELRARRSLQKALRHHDQCVRIAAVKGSARLGGLCAVWRLVRLLGDTDRQVAHAAAEGISRMKGRGVLWALARCVGSEDGMVRYFGVTGLERIVSAEESQRRAVRKATALLEAAQSDEHELVRDTARQTLQRRRMPTG